MPKHNVKPGECIESIAFEYGFFWEKIWNHPNNSKLKKKRKDQNVLLVGDEVFIPDKTKKEVSKSTGEQHEFKFKGVPSKLEIQLLDTEGKPRKDLEYVLEIEGGKTHEDKVPGDGWIKKSVMPNAKKANLTLADKDGNKEIYEISLGKLDPIDDVRGAQQRLYNLGYVYTELDGTIGSGTKASIREFQLDSDLDITGKLDAQTVDKLEKLHAS
jgi:hypothetical protein